MSAPNTKEILAELEALDKERERRKKKNDPWRYIPHIPHDKQKLFLSFDTDREVLYGGAAGGGKSDALLMAALRYVDVPGYSALILRRTYQDLSLPNAIMSRAQVWLANTDVVWRAVDRQFVFPSGARLTFGYLNLEKDRLRYASAEFQCICFDELTQFPERWYTFLFSRLRGPADPDNPLSKVPLRVRGATNPGGIGHGWVMERFGLPEQIEFNQLYKKEGRVFVPSRLEDNPSLNLDAYDQSLSQLGPEERAQLRHGKWIRDVSSLVYHYFTDECLIEEAPELDSYILGVDFGFKDDTAFAVLGWRKDDPTVYVVHTYKMEGMTPSDAAEYIVELGQQYSFDRIVGDCQGLGKGYAEEAIKRFGIPIEPADKGSKRAYIDYLNGATAKGQLKCVESETYHLVSEWKSLVWKDESRQREHEGFANHLSDACLYAYRACMAYVEKVPEKKPDKWSPEWREKVNETLKEERRVAQIVDVRQRMGPYWKVAPSRRVR